MVSTLRDAQWSPDAMNSQRLYVHYNKPAERLTLTHPVCFVQSKGTVTHWLSAHVEGAVGLQVSAHLIQKGKVSHA